MLSKQVIDRELLYINRALFHDLTVQGISVSNFTVKS
ncbi:RAxF-45 family protein [Halobacillus seohaensis]|uniref:RAxF-45 family protein n=1 Tax=Halobacillus seohaensis TaxID=447421 RepID=A0ABW2EMZ9_9BACI